MELSFFKYEGTGNDFIMVDNRTGFFPKDDTLLVARLCDRRFGIGGDGLILLEHDAETDLRMIYYNADGREGSMCGNGGRCIVAFAKNLGIISDSTVFVASDGIHHASITEDNLVSLQMKDVGTVDANAEYIFLDTGSPHHIELVDDLENFDVAGEGAKIRYSDLYGQAGSNINFVNPKPDGSFSIRTYERGVEAETLSCGTGATAVAIAMFAIGRTKSKNVKINVAGGYLEISFKEAGGIFTDVHLKGPATFVFEGTISI